ncbi:phosphatase PAP2 family protein [bacterium]|nr:phosphatase PAP2 family protein [bacterium]
MKLVLILAITLVFLSLSFILPFIHPGMNAGKDLTSIWHMAAYWLSESAGPVGMPIWVLPVIIFLMAKSTPVVKKRVLWTAVTITGLIVFLAGGAQFNEHVLKPYFKNPRPNMVELLNGEDYKITYSVFYDEPDKEKRRDYLRQLIGDDFQSRHGFDIHPLIAEHWIHETGFSFPSGHSFASMMFATFCLVWVIRRRLPFRPWLILIGWSVAVCYSRCILRVHWPMDIFFGAMQGMIGGGFLAYLLFSILKVNKENSAS